MNPITWGDDELRSFVASFNGFSFLFEDRSDEFRAAAAVQLVPRVRSRLLESLGAPTNANGLAHVALCLVEDLDDAERDWLLVCEEPWERLALLVERRLVRAHRRTAGKETKAALEGIATASTRRSIER